VALSVGKAKARLTGDGGLSNRRVWADLGEGTQYGICVNAQDAVWYVDVPNKRGVRVAEGGQAIDAY
jgi:hypothetical protein